MPNREQTLPDLDPTALYNALQPLEQEAMRFCSASAEDMVYLIDLTTTLAGLPKTLQGQWFDAALLSPEQKDAYSTTSKMTMKAVRQLFRLRLMDVGREETCPEGFVRRHSEIIRALQSHPAWDSRDATSASSITSLESQVRFHTMWRDATELTPVQKEMGGAVELIGLSERGSELVSAVLRNRKC